jgi:predicted ATP-grasp superfamily ATP-dependent carboligase
MTNRRNPHRTFAAGASAAATTDVVVMVRGQPESRTAVPSTDNRTVTDIAGSPRVPVLVLGKHITGLGALRTFAKRGIEAYVIEDTQDVITRSRWYRRPATTLRETTDGEELGRYLRELKIERAVLFPCSDRWTQAVAARPDDVRERFPASVPSRDVVDTFIDKERFRQLVERLEIPAPRTMPIVEPSDLDTAPPDLLRTAFLKPTDSQRYGRRFGTKGFFVDDLPAARRHVAAAAAEGVGFMLQEWIPGEIGATILLDGFVDRAGSIRGIQPRRRVRMDPPRLANTACSVTIPMAEVKDAVATARRLVEAIDYRGIFSVEFKQDARDGQWKIIELNPRAFWMVANVATAGLDVPWMSYLDALEQPVPALTRYQVGRYGHYEAADAAAIVRAWAHGRRPNGSVLRPWLLGDHLMFWWSDPVPGLLDVRNALVRRAGGALAAIRRSIPLLQGDRVHR